MDTIRYRFRSVRKGVELLDKTFGPDWDKRVNLDTLDLSSTCGCILGQVNKFSPRHTVNGSRFTRLAERLGIFGEARLYGFDANAGKGATYSALDREWKRVIRARRSARVAATIDASLAEAA